MSDLLKKFQIPGYMIVALIGLLIFKYGYPHLQHARFEHKIQKLINYNRDIHVTPLDEWDIREQILFKAKQLNIKFNPNDLIISEQERDLIVKLHYSVVVNLYVTKFTLEFSTLLRSD